MTSRPSSLASYRDVDKALQLEILTDEILVNLESIFARRSKQGVALVISLFYLADFAAIPNDPIKSREFAFDQFWHARRMFNYAVAIHCEFTDRFNTALPESYQAKAEMIAAERVRRI